MSHAQRVALLKLRDRFGYDWFYLYLPTRNIIKETDWMNIRKRRDLYAVASEIEKEPGSYCRLSRFDQKRKKEERIPAATMKSLIRRGHVIYQGDMGCVRSPLAKDSRIRLLLGVYDA